MGKLRDLLPSAPVPRLAAVLVATAFSAGSAGAQDGDPRLGEVLFDNHCGICHAIDLPHTVFGPHLVDVFGREAGAVSNYRYTYEMRTSGIVWDEETLDALITDPQGLVPGTNMYFRGVPDPANRAHIIAYLKQKSQAD
ncbi:MAG: c-type cytochrome [Phycisphaeraceae bacterium]